MAEFPPLPVDSTELADSAGLVNEKPPVSLCDFGGSQSRDLVFAGLACIEKRGGNEFFIKTDDRGRTININALQHTFSTHLLKAGVPLRTVQAAMRHSDPRLTANVYTGPKLLDVAGAVASLPDLPLAVVGGPAILAAREASNRPS